MIPKIIHQTYKNTDLPAEISAGMQALRDINPDWSHSFYTDTDCIEFIASNFDRTVLESYLSINPVYGAARADLFRYLLIYYYGGVYLDIKSTVSHPLSEITEKESYLLSHWDNSKGGTHFGWGRHKNFTDMPYGEFQQWYIASEPGHPFLLQVIKSVLYNIKNYSSESYGVGKRGVLKTTGPIAYTLAIRSCLPFAPHRLARNNHILGFVYSVFQENGRAPLYHQENMPHQHYSSSDEPIILKRPKSNTTQRQSTNENSYFGSSIDVNKLIKQATTCHQRGQLNEAQEIYEQILKVNPRNFDALLSMATLLLKRKQFLGAIRFFESALVVNLNSAEAYYNRGVALKELKRLDEALQSYDRAVQLKPDHANAYYRRGIALKELKRLDEALQSYDQAVQLKPDHANAFYGRGVVLKELKRLDEALKSYDQAIELKPDHANAYYRRGIVLKELKRSDEALKSYDQAIKLKPDHANAYASRGNLFRELRRLDEALQSYDKAIQLKPEFDYIFGRLLYSKMHLCDWVNYDQFVGQLINKTHNQERVSSPFSALALTDDPLAQKKSAEIYVKNKYPIRNLLPKIGKYPLHPKLRIGYFSADFHNHATMHLMAELFESHDRAQFELYGFSFGPNSQDEWRKRAESSFDHFFNVRNKSDLEICSQARGLEIDIAVDLKGFTRNSRAGIFSYRAAPIQVNYLGYPGTMGSEYIDYIFADRILIPEDKRKFYSEKVVYMPDSYQVNIRDRVISDKSFSRQEVGLPDGAFVFCSFNNNYKITPEIFDCWMRILGSVENGVLWIYNSNEAAANNLKKEAEQRGVDGKRLVFASKMPVEEHLKRIQLADLFLDTFPCNAHTTASDALRVGLPIVTLRGDSFASRVASSLLSAIGLAELITTNGRDYETLAVELATYPGKLQVIKNKLLGNLPAAPLYNPHLFTRHLESAYKSMYQRYQNDLAPDHIFI